MRRNLIDGSGFPLIFAGLRDPVRITESEGERLGSGISGVAAGARVFPCNDLLLVGR